MPGNAIEMLPACLFDLKSLEHVDVSHNRLSSLSSQFRDLTSLCLFDISGNTGMVSPPASFLTSTNHARNQRDAILSYFDHIETSGSCALRRFRLVVLGDVMAGKTSFIRSIQRDQIIRTEANERTRVLDVTSMSITHEGSHPSSMLQDDDDGHSHREPAMFDVFDFGGHEEYGVMHQVFLAGVDRTLFMLVVAMDTDPSLASIAQWMTRIFQYTRRAAIILVATKYDMCPSRDVFEQRVAMLHAYAHEVARDILARERTKERIKKRFELSHEIVLPDLSQVIFMTSLCSLSK